MEIILRILIIFTCSFYVEAISCGPNGNCSCTVNQEMDCSETFLQLRDICKEIGNLTVNKISGLRVERNDIDAISNRDLFGCEELAKLHLTGNQISEIGKLVFHGFHKLNLLDLSDNRLVRYYQETGRILYFPGTLKTLMLNSNSGINVSGNFSYPVLHSLGYLTMLYLDGLPNGSFPDSYRNLRNLRNLTLSGWNGYCSLSELSNTTFENVPYIKVLNISNCKIKNIHAGTFQKLPMLERLDLSSNKQLGFRVARNITYGLQFTNIKFINYSKVFTTFGIGTQITKRDVCYLWNTSLNEIDLSSNRLVMFETNALILLPTSLKTVHIEDNKFTFTPYCMQIGCASNVTEFHGNRQNSAHSPELFFSEPVDPIPKEDASFNDCPYMKDDYLRNISLRKEKCPFIENSQTFTLPQIPKSLLTAYFSNCGLQYNVSSFPILPTNNSVEVLDFSGNVLSAWTGSVGPLPKLKHLDLSRNYCSYIGPLATKFLGTVENLQIQQNFIGLVLANTDNSYQIFGGLTNLRTLNLSSNIISSIPPSTFSKMTKLETLDLSVNNIDVWTIDVRKLKKLKYLNLRFNSIRSLPKSLRKRLEKNVKSLKQSFKIDLRNNTITCTCDEKDFLMWMVKHKSSMVGFKEYTFCDANGTTISVENFIAQVENLERSCGSYVLTLVLSSIGVSVFLAIVIVGIIYRKRWTFIYLTRMAKIRYFGYKPINEEVEETYVYDAFISYSDEDRDFTLDKLVHHLEDQNLKLCLHERDFRPGRNVHDNIVGAIRNSRKTVAVISENFLKSSWCIYEFNMARMDSMYSREGANCLVVVKLTGVPVQSMSNEMLAWIKANTYLKYTENEDDEPHFWESLCNSVKRMNS